jgi:ophiobolin F synthase
MTSPDLISPMTSPGWISPLSSPTWSESAHDCASIENFRFPTPTVLNNQTLLEPYEWCANLPQKNARNILIDAVNFWTQVPEPTANEIESAIAELHTAFLLLDDIEDASDIRRGKPTAHLIFGVSETINSANYAIFEALDRLRRLPNAPLDELATQMRHLFTGQCHELRFTRQGVCPSEAEYFQIIDSKTGGLFRMLVGLLTAHAAPSTAADAAKDDLTQLFTLVGRALQIRGDYLNLTAAQAGDAQGFGDDIDEGKFSYPMVDAFGSQTSATAAHVSVLRAVLAARREAGGLSREMKELACEKLVACGALRRTREKLVSLLGQIDERLVLVEELFRCENPLLRSMLERLAL